MSKKRQIKKQDMENEWASFDAEMKHALNHYSVEYPDESQIQRTINTLRPYVPQKKLLLKRQLQLLIFMAVQEFSYINPLFWITNSTLFVIGCILILTGQSNPYLLSMSIAPIPFILGVTEIFKSWQQNMHELELTTKHSLQEIMLSKMVLIGVFNILLNVLTTLVVSLIIPNVWIWKLILYWLTPFTVIAAFTFLIASKFRNGYVAAVASLVIWLSIISGMAISENIKLWLENMQTINCLLLILLSVALLVWQAWLLGKNPVQLTDKHSLK